MTASDTQLIDLPIAVVQERNDDFKKRVLRRNAKGAYEEYAKAIAKTKDWVILEQPVKTLPRSLTELISLQLRDEGNTLIEETRQINNRYIGYSMSEVRTLLMTDLEPLDLRERILVWAEAVTKAVLFKLRRQAADDPFRVFSKLYDSFITEIDTTIAYGDTHMYSLMWAAPLDAIPYWLNDVLFIQTGLLKLWHSNDELHSPNMQGRLLFNQQASAEIPRIVSLYGVETSIYTRDVILKPLIKAMLAGEPLPSVSEMQREIAICLSDLLEAFPLLLSSKRIARHLITLPGSSCVAAFNFLANEGFARIFLSDNEARFKRDIETSFCRGLLQINFDGRISCHMHPWLTLERMFDPQTSLVLTYWLLKQFHPRVVADYLKIRDTNKHDPLPETATPVATDDASDLHLASYTDWVEEASTAITSDFEAIEDGPGATVLGLLPQMRRSRFFKLLSHCGVAVEQGKGSEIKLLKANAHPFRLGNHYGPNPTVPSFLIASILKRLDITREEWREALATVSPLRVS